MKNATSYFFALLVIGSLSIAKANSQPKEALKGNISISGAFALYPLTVKWAEEFKKIHPGVKIDISAGGAGKGITDVLSNMVDIGLVSREINPDELKKGAYAIALSKDAVVPTVSEKNPNIKDILTIGLDREAAVNIFITGKTKTWGQALGTKSAVPVRIYTRSDACGAAETWAAYLGKKQEDLLGVGVFGDPGLAQAVSKDPSGIAYNNIGYAYDAKTKKPNPGIKVLPLDINNNGKIDPDENFYATMDDIVSAIASGKYPSPPARDLYFVTLKKPVKKELVEFIRWSLTEGQKYVFDSGYINLSKEKLAVGLEQIK
ncbi:MAG: substrate-binding domain-containing protein [Bacteroidota bacterium]|nr:substrate-binding domain-containing protein [Bacteroidota bacterium]MDO9614942.1 substrate-binding domain-containing protein [Bacteroidota bacterium]